LKPSTAGSKSPQNKQLSTNRHSGAIGQLRIIGGTWRGRKLSFPEVEGLRQRETEYVKRYLIGFRLKFKAHAAWIYLPDQVL
jgi:hypothetical protein